MNIETWALIRRLHFQDHLKIRAIARQLKIGRKAVRRAIAMKTYSASKKRKGTSILDPFKPRIKSLLKDYPALNAVRILEEITHEGYTGSLTLLRCYLRNIRPRPKEVFSKLHFEPAEAFQVDWASLGTISHEGVAHRLYALLLVACYSRYLYVAFTLSMKTEEFLRCHQMAFDYFGGVFRYGMYDNCKNAVLSHLKGAVHFHPKLLAFCDHYLFEPRACRPRRPQEKGIVENAVRYLKSSFMAGRRFTSLSQLKAESLNWMNQVANVRIHKTTRKRPIDLFEKEKALLRKLPEHAMDVRIVRTVKVTHQFRINFESNTYTVPPKYVGQTLTLKASFLEVTLYHLEIEVAKHTRSYRRGIDVADKSHEERQRALKRRVDRSLMERDFRNLSPEAGSYLEGLSKGALNATVQIKKILDLVPLYGKTEICQAIQKALAFDAFGFGYIHNLVIQSRNRKNTPPHTPVILPQIEDLESLAFEERDLGDYDQFLEERKTDDDEETEPPDRAAG